MLIDFCHWSLRPSISCDRPCTDGCGIENLVAKPSLVRKGYVAESFVKPPVEITIDFPINIHIFKIIIDPVVGQQKSSNIDIYTKSQKVNFLKNEPEMIVTACDTKQVYRPSPRGNVACISLRNPAIICFKNHGFTPHPPVTSVDLQDDITYPYLRNLTTNSSRFVSFVSQVIVRITQTAGSSIPAIKRIEVWGQPSYSVDTSLKQQAFQLFADATMIASTIVKLSSSSPVNNSGYINKTSDPQILNGIEIPDEFVDPISCEVMTIPMLLPSGKNVDQLTIEKHNNNEANWGRAPNDPFTGVPFNTQMKPIPSGHLKTRIDRFLLINSAMLKSVPRTVGRRSDVFNVDIIAGNVIQRQPANSSGKDRPRKRKSYFENVNHQYSDISVIKEVPPASNNSGKKSRVYSNVLFSDKSLQKPNLTASVSSDFHPDVVNKRKCCPDLEDRRSVKMNNNQPGSSLDSAISNALVNLPSFTSFSKNKHIQREKVLSNEKLNENSCYSCSNDRIDKMACQTRYRLPCGHVVCRSCLLADKSGTCQNCKFKYLSKDVVKIF